MKAAKVAGGVREGSKTAQALALLRRPNGATLAELMKALSWQAHTVRGFISRALGKKMDLPVVYAKREDGIRGLQPREVGRPKPLTPARRRLRRAFRWAPYFPIGASAGEK